MNDKYETGECRKFVFWVVYDSTGGRQFVKMDSDTGCLAMFDNEESAAAFASGLVGVGCREVVLYSCPQPDVQGEPVGAEQQPDVTLLLELLSHARCNTCDGSGGLYDNHGHPHQCQWCHDRSKALAAHRKGVEE